ncbi:MAG: glycosyl transferase family 2 [Verrucomicrobia bacterium]|nr:glycosyl transferase family 2 [Verrucomicrobiota bacterium]
MLQVNDMEDPRFSIVIPARDEEKCIGRCIASIREAAKPFGGQVEIIVALNRCTDRTGEIAGAQGAVICRDDSKNLARIRNAGAMHARGEVLATIDADSIMSENMLVEIDRSLRSGKYIGGGVMIYPERYSIGIVMFMLAMIPLVFIKGLAAGVFWCYRKDFEAIQGFDERLVTAEDIDFAARLKAHGRKLGKRFGFLRKAYIVTSCRKFDHFGDWYLIRHPVTAWRAIRGRDQRIGDMFFYDFKH